MCLSPNKKGVDVSRRTLTVADASHRSVPVTLMVSPVLPQFTLYFDSAAKERSPALAPGHLISHLAPKKCQISDYTPAATWGARPVVRRDLGPNGSTFSPQHA